jgi:hypothetical protein
MMFVRSLSLAVLFLGVLGSIAAASAQKDLDSAAKHEKIAFILVTDQGATGVDQAKDMIEQAMKQVKKAEFVELDRSDPKNQDLVAKYRLAGAPVPLVLVAARNGVLAGGLPVAQATADKLVGMVPSPKKAEILQVLQSGKAVFVSASRKGMATQSGATAACAAACGQLQEKCVTVQIDMDDPLEAAFLTQMKVDLASTEPVTLVVNAQGQVTGTYSGAADVAALVQAATTKAGGCCPSTVQNPNASCAPPKK